MDFKMKDLKRPSSLSRETKRIKKILNEEIRLGISPNSDSETEDVDLKKELQPLSYYINNREEMIEQMFSIIKGDKLRKMLPPILKDTALDELKADCLIHLLGMSKKRILAIIEGKEINSSSDSESNSDCSSLPSKKRHKMVKPIIIKQEGCSDISDNSEEVVLIDPDLEFLNISEPNKGLEGNPEGSRKSKKHRKKDAHQKIQISNKKHKKKENLQSSNKSPDISRKMDSSSGSDDEENDQPQKPPDGTSLLEILELEMRARAIRALLQKNEVLLASPSVANDKEKQGSSSKSNNKSCEETVENDCKIIENTNESKGESAIPVRKRKKKRKSDDVIVITPKVITIDLTDENDSINIKRKSKESVQSNSHTEQNKIHEEFNKVVQEINNLPIIDLNTDECSNETKKPDGCDSVNKQQKPCIQPEISLDSPKQSSSQSILNVTKNATQQKSSWVQRWLDSKEVKKVVSTSKIYGNVRKRIKNAKISKQTKENPQNVVLESQKILGSVDEYQSLSKSNAKLSDIHISNSEDNSLLSVESDIVKQAELISMDQVQHDVALTKDKEAITCVKLKDSRIQVSSGKAVTTNQNESPNDYTNVSSSNKITFHEKKSVDTPCPISRIEDSLQQPSSVDCVNQQEEENQSIIIESGRNELQSNSISNGSNEKLFLTSSETCTQSHSHTENKEIETEEQTPCNNNFSSTVNQLEIKGADMGVTQPFPKHNKFFKNESRLGTSLSSQQINPKEEQVIEEISNLDKASKVSVMQSKAPDELLEKNNKGENIESQEFNEPETLEINITDEDREIDAIADDKLGDGKLEITASTQSEVIVID